MIDTLRLFDIEAQVVIKNLINAFKADKKAFGGRSHLPTGKCSIGIEVEVKWRDYFPKLWKEYFKNGERKYSDIPLIEQVELSRECAELEKSLLSRLERTVQCGIPRGADKYWEFAFKPIYNVYYVAEQIEILRQYELIPNRGRHSLHITVGHLKPTRDVYYMLNLLELFFADKERIEEGFNKANDKMSATWARKGYGGIFKKEEHELQDAKVAVELRTLYLPKTEQQLMNMLEMVQELSNIIYDKQNGIKNPLIESWNALVERLAKNLTDRGMTDANWKKPNLDPNWVLFIDHFDDLKKDAQGAWQCFNLSKKSKNSLAAIHDRLHLLSQNDLSELQTIINERKQKC